MVNELDQTKLETSYGIIKYEGRKVYLDINRDFQDYYYSLIPKYYYAMKPKHPPHITIVRSKYEIITRNYGLWDGMRSPFVYSPIIRQDRLDFHGRSDSTYFWLDCFSVHIGLLREELGLTWFRRGFHSYHITIANLKNK